MGLYLRRSIRVGPLRFNFSTSGIGVSAGIPGFRVGTGPRGAYVHMGAGGLYYRQSLGGRQAASPGLASPDGAGTPSTPLTPLGDMSLGPMEEIDSTSVLQLRDSSSQALLEEIQHRRSMHQFAPWVLLGVGLFVLGLWALGVRGIPLLAPLGPGVIAFWWARGRDAIRRTVVVAYDLDPDATRDFEVLMEAIAALGAVGSLWHVDAEAEVHDRKYHAGASTVIKREPTRPTVGQPPVIRTNLDVPSLKVGRQQLCFFPDRLFVFEPSGVGAIGYDALRVEVSTTRFIEDGHVPADAEVVDQTWRYVNKKGGPDKRFSDNRMLPVALYETIHFRSTSGLNELLHASRSGVGSPISDAVTRMGLTSKRAPPTPRTPNAVTSERETQPSSQSQAVKRHRPPNPTPPAEGPQPPNPLRRGRTAETLVDRGQAWEYRSFALALIDVMTDPPTVPVVHMPTDLSAARLVAEWASAQLKVPIQVCTTFDRLVNIDLQKALGPEGKPGDPDAILNVAWNIGLQSAHARAWSMAVWTTPVPQECVSLREELARTVDQPLREIADFGPMLLASIEEHLSAPSGVGPRALKMTLTLQLENERALRRAIEAAIR